MQNPDFELPTAAPEGTGLESPIKFELAFKTGKTAEGYGQLATPEMSKAGFNYYSKDLGERVTLQSLTLFVVGVYVQIGGDFPGSDGKFRHFASNLVTDLRGQKIEYREQYIKGGGLRCWGTKDEIEKWARAQGLPDAATGFRIVLVCSSPDFAGLVELQCSQRIEAAMANAIAGATGQKPKKGFVFNLCALSSQFWGFSFTNTFVKTTKECAPWEGKGEMFFQPVFSSCGIVTQEKNPQKWGQLNNAAEEVTLFVNNLSDRLQKRATEIGGTIDTTPTADTVPGYVPPPPTGGYPVAPPAQPAPATQIMTFPAGPPETVPPPVDDFKDLPF